MHIMIIPQFARVTKLAICAALLAAAAASSSSSFAADSKPATIKDELQTPPENYITVSGQANRLTGDKSTFQAQNWTAKNGFGGIQDFQYSQNLGKDFTANVDGHALYGNEDYLVHLNIAKNEIGSVDAGYKRFRTYYDNAGGFFLPTSASWLPLFPQELSVDRGKFWAEVNLTLPNAPVFTLRYTNELRNGRKDTTVWGASDFTGVPVLTNSNANLASRYISPGYLELGERHETLEAITKHTVGRTTIELSVVGDRVNNLDTRVGNRYPGEVRFPTIPTTPVVTLAPSDYWRINNQAVAYDQLNNKTKTFSTTAKVETLISEKIKAHAAASYSLLNSDFTEDRPITTQTPYGGTPATGIVPVFTNQVHNLIGGAKVKSYTATLGTEIKATHNLTIEANLKGEDLYTKATESADVITATAPTTAGLYTQTITPYNASSRSKETALVPELSARYKGIKNILVYGTAEYRYVSGDERVTNLHANTAAIAADTTIGNPNVITGSGNSINATYKDVHENHARYTVGANWVPSSYFNLRAETFYKDHKNAFAGYGATKIGSDFGYEMKGGRITATVKPLPTVSATTRYIYQMGTMQSSGFINASNVFYPTVAWHSMDSKSHNIGETIDWTPIKQFYMQANLNVVYQTTSTSYPRAGTTANDMIHNADNNYINGSLIAGVVVDKLTNAEFQYTWYTADNYEPALNATGLAYGAGQKDYTITVGLKRKLTDKLLAEAKLGYLSSKNDTTGGRTNYKGTIAYVSLQQAF